LVLSGRVGGERKRMATFQAGKVGRRRPTGSTEQKSPTVTSNKVRRDPRGKPKEGDWVQRKVGGKNRKGGERGCM